MAKQKTCRNSGHRQHRHRSVDQGDALGCSGVHPLLSAAICAPMACRRPASSGVPISDRGLDAIVQQADNIDIVFDATSAAAHLEHWPVLQKLGKMVIDMTPAKLGDLCVPAINTEQILESRAKNINMITCGGQASVPIANAIAAGTGRHRLHRGRLQHCLTQCRPGNSRQLG